MLKKNTHFKHSLTRPRSPATDGTTPTEPRSQHGVSLRLHEEANTTDMPNTTQEPWKVAHNNLPDNHLLKQLTQNTHLD